MGTIDRWFTTQATVRRLVASGAKENYQNVGTVMGHIQEFSGRQIIDAQTLFEPVHFWCSLDSDVRYDDILMIGLDKYLVKGVTRRTEGSNPHLDCVIDKGEAKLN